MVVRVVSVLLAFAVFTAPAAAFVWHVDPEGGGDAPSIAAAVWGAAAGDTVLLACGTYFEHDILVTVPLTIRSEGGTADGAVIDAGQRGRVLVSEFLPGELVCCGITFANGFVGDVAADGGGMSCRGGALRLERCAFTGNHAQHDGGGLYVNGAAVVLQDCVFLGNDATASGGAVKLYLTSGEYRGCRFEANSALDGGAFHIRFSAPLFSHCTFYNNTCHFFGGALFCELSASPTLAHCTFAGNQGGVGAAIDATHDCTVPLTDSIVAYSGRSPALHCEPNAGNPAAIVVSCSDLYGNARGNASGTMDDPVGVDGTIDAEPAFCDFGSGDLHLAGDSPCLPAHNDCGTLMGAYGRGCPITAAAGPVAAGVVLRASPNPFNPSTTINFSLPVAGRATLAVFDVAGRRVSTLVDGVVAAGASSCVWEGRDDGGRDVPSGVYQVRLTAAGTVQREQVTLVR